VIFFTAEIQNVTVWNSAAREYNIKHLKPYKIYKVQIAIVDQEGAHGRKSVPTYFTTLEGGEPFEFTYNKVMRMRQVGMASEGQV